MTQTYNEYLEQIKQKLDAMNKASGFQPSPSQNKIDNQQNMPSNQIFDMLGQGAKRWMERDQTGQDPDNNL